MKKIASILKIFKSSFSNDDSYRNLLTNKKLVSTEKALLSQKASKGSTYYSLLKYNEDINITIEENAINESIKRRCRKQKKYPLQEILNSEFANLNFDDFSRNGLKTLALDPAVIEKLKCVEETSVSQILEDYCLSYVALREEVKSELITNHIYRVLRNSLSRVYKEIQNEFHQIPLKFTFFEFFDQLFSLKRSSNFSTELIKTLFKETQIKYQNDRKIYRVVSITY